MLARDSQSLDYVVAQFPHLTCVVHTLYPMVYCYPMQLHTPTAVSCDSLSCPLIKINTPSPSPPEGNSLSRIIYYENTLQDDPIFAGVCLQTH